MKPPRLTVSILAAALLAAGLAAGCHGPGSPSGPELAGVWRGRVVGQSGALAAMKDLQFMYAFHADGTMSESSNYDAAPPVPPAYGVWRQTGARQYEARYEFFQTQATGILDEIAKGGGWAPGGHGVLRQKITLTGDGRTFDSTIGLELFDQQGKPMDGGGVATGPGERLGF